jgi:Ca-activated chloride channel family protein
MSVLPGDFHFLRPAWLLALLLLPLLLRGWRQRQAAADPWRAACDAHLLAHLRQAGAGARGRLLPRLVALGFSIAVLALAGPAFRLAPQPLARAESALIVALDLSARMLATDLKPDRLGRARFKVADLLAARREGQTALIAYAGDAFTVAPLTDDANSLGDLLAALTPDTMPVGGQRPDRAIVLAQKLLRDGGHASGELLLVTDAVDARALAAAERARTAGLQVSVLGAGTPEGAPVALPQGGFVQDESGNVLLPRLEEDALQALATAGGGRYARLSLDRRDLAELGLGAPTLGDTRLREDERTRPVYHDEGPWLLLALLPLAALGFRRGWLGCVLVAMLLPAPRAEAFDWASLWTRDDQRAWQALQAGEAQRALELAQDPAVRGGAAYRAGDFPQSAQAYAGAKDADAHYNRGNALARAQRYAEAIAAYDEALRLDPAMEDAHANRRAVEEFLKQQQEQSPSEQQQGEGSKPPPGAEGEEQEPSEQEAKGEQSSDNSRGNESQADPSAADPSQAQDDAEAEQQEAQQRFGEQMDEALEKAGEQSAERAPANDPREAEKQQAVEQWLRRVPDDPGGLLRRKFALEHQRRRSAGDDE